jgi:hypothetical protein
MLWSLGRDLPAAEVRPVQYYVDQWLSQRKFNTLLLGIFAVLALLLGVMGVYGVLANLVASRTREIGIQVGGRGIAGSDWRSRAAPEHAIGRRQRDSGACGQPCPGALPRKSPVSGTPARPH